MSPLEVVIAGPYNLFYTCAIGAAAASMFLAGRRRGWNSSHWALAVAGWATAAMVGAMLPHALLGDAVGYRTSVGAVIFASLALALMARALRQQATDVLDTTAVAIPLASAIVHIGCFLAECCQGATTSLPIGVALHPDDVPRYPVQLYESALELGVAMLIARRSVWARPGQSFATSIAGMCVIRVAADFLRDNDKYLGLSLAQWIALPIGVLCLTLIFSRPRATTPRRVLTSGARHATIFVAASLAIATLLVELPALESTVLLMGIPIVLVVAMRQLRRIAPTGLAALALQVPAISADSTYPRVYRFLGAGANMGTWNFVHHRSDCGGTTEEWSRQHSAKGVSFEAGSRKQVSATQAFGIRGRAYYGTDVVGAAVVTTGTPVSPAGRSRISSGGQVVADVDWKHLGLSFGVSVGRFHPMAEESSYEPGEQLDGVTSFPAFGLRLGPQRGFSFETRVGDESPMWTPGPSSTFAFAYGDGAGNRIRIGGSEGGILIAGNKMTATGLEIVPTFVLDAGGSIGATKVFQGGITFRKWIRGAPRRQDGR